MNKKLMAVGAAAAMSISIGPWAAHADGGPTVEGRAYTLGSPFVATNGNTVIWGCAATVDDAAAVSTSVTCTLLRGGVPVSTQTATAEGNTAATTPVKNDVSFKGGVKYCWTAEAWLADGTRVTDDTGPNCI